MAMERGTIVFSLFSLIFLFKLYLTVNLAVGLLVVKNFGSSFPLESSRSGSRRRLDETIFDL
jgi:hypothetical protein